MQRAAFEAKLSPFLIDVSEDIVITMLVEHFFSRISGDFLRMLVPE